MNDLFVRRRGEVSGPYPAEEIRAMITRGEIVPLHELSYDGLEWIRAGKIWNEFVPKPKSMFEMSELRPMSVKPAVQPVDIHKNLSRRSKSSAAPSEASSPAASPEVRRSATPQPSSVVGDEARDELTDATDGEYDDDRKPRPEPTVGMKSLNAIAILVGVFTLLVMLLALICVGLDLHTLDSFQPVTLDRLSQLYTSGMFAWSDFARLVLAVCKLIQFILFMAWVYFSAVYLYEKSRGRLQFAPGWCVGWFFVPVANLWKPYQVVTELQHRSESFLRFDDPRIIREPLVGFWWTCWVLEIAAYKYLAWSVALLPKSRAVVDNLTHAQIERLGDVPQLFADFLAAEIGAICVTFIAGIALLVLIYRFEKIRPKWETRSRRRRTN